MKLFLFCCCILVSLSAHVLAELDLHLNEEIESGESILSAVSKVSPRLLQLLDGISMIAIKDMKNAYFIPSTMNTFGSVRVEILKYDSGSDTHVLPLDDGEIVKLNELYPESYYSFQTSTSTNHGLTLLIRADNSSKFEVNLATDIFKNNPRIRLRFLRFSLCIDDAKTIIKNELLFDRFSDRDQLVLIEYINRKQDTRKTFGILGQDIIQQFTVLKHDGCVVMIDPTVQTNFSMLSVRDAFMKISDIKLHAESDFFDSVVSQRDFHHLDVNWDDVMAAAMYMSSYFEESNDDWNFGDDNDDGYMSS